MQILAVPLAHQRATAKNLFVFVVRASLAEKETGKPARVSFMQRMVNRASDFWIGLGRTDVKSTFDWRRRTFALGERIMDSISYEEWELKNIDQQLGGSMQSLLKAFQEQRETKPLQIEFAPQISSPSETTESVMQLVKKSVPYHRRMLIYNLIGVVVTSPLFIIPAVPNLPTYYLLWRAWSHWRAGSVSRDLTTLLQHDLIEVVPNGALGDQFASEHALETHGDWELYLTKERIESLVAYFELSSQVNIDLCRAYDQIVAQMKKDEPKKEE
ncbi:hypothetical protein CBS9595_002308 [Malassezia furfur]|nr:hypothetical protein CBS9595_002308 [Malassezia furfur]